MHVQVKALAAAQTQEVTPGLLLDSSSPDQATNSKQQQQTFVGPAAAAAAAACPTPVLGMTNNSLM
jgi:hypothetical protein